MEQIWKEEREKKRNVTKKRKNKGKGGILIIRTEYTSNYHSIIFKLYAGHCRLFVSTNRKAQRPQSFHNLVLSCCLLPWGVRRINTCFESDVWFIFDLHREFFFYSAHTSDQKLVYPYSKGGEKRGPLALLLPPRTRFLPIDIYLHTDDINMPAIPIGHSYNLVLTNTK